MNFYVLVDIGRISELMGKFTRDILYQVYWVAGTGDMTFFLLADNEGRFRWIRMQYCSRRADA